jgi:acetoacetate decarboxylase
MSAIPAHSTPREAPLVPPFPIGYRNASVLTACYRTDTDAIDALLPAPLRRVSDVVMVHIYDMPDVDHMGAVRECNVMVGAAFGNGGDLAVGREVHGQPKKLAHPRLEHRGDLTVGSVERNGIEILTATMAYKQRRAELAELAEHFEFAENLNYKAIPQIDGSPAIAQITARRLSELHVHECWRSPCSVELRANVQAPVYLLPVRVSLDAFFWRADFTLVPGRVLHDYLGEGAG